MRNLNELNAYRDEAAEAAIYGVSGGETEGVFRLEYRDTNRAARYWSLLAVIASVGDGWDHVSVRLSRRVPTWYELEFVKRLFFKDDEVAMQLHVPPAKHINVQRNTLHLWRPCQGRLQLPPEYMV